jgi:TRAP-type C4-dicarboxylate transport system permease small subunit
MIVGRHLLRGLDWLCDISSLTILYVTVVVIFVQVIARYVLKVALPWTEEFARYAFIWLIFLANALAERRKEHFRVSYFVEQAPRRVRYALWVFDEVLIFVFFIWLLQDSLQFVKMGKRMISTCCCCAWTGCTGVSGGRDLQPAEPVPQYRGRPPRAA